VPTHPDGGEPPRRSRLRVDRILLLSVTVLVISFVAGYVLIRHATTFSWSYITNSVVLSVLFVTNAILVLTLLILLMRNLIKALVERRRGILGSRFRTKLVFSLLLLWLVPSGIIFWAAMQLIQRSIDRWFNEPMDRLTEASQQIVDTYYDDARDRAAGSVRRRGTRPDRRGQSALFFQRPGHRADRRGQGGTARAPGTAGASPQPEDNAGDGIARR